MYSIYRLSHPTQAYAPYHILGTLRPYVVDMCLYPWTSMVLIYGSLCQVYCLKLTVVPG